MALRKTHLRSARITQPKLEVTGNNSLPIVTWNTGSIDALPTRKVQAVRRLTWRGVLFWLLWWLFVVVLVGSLVFVWWIAGRYAAL